MLEIEEMTEKEAHEAMARIGYGHLACCRNNFPYVVPIHYACDEGNIYIYSTEGKKSEILRVNPEICLQAEDVKDNETWTSVMVVGSAEQLTEEVDRQHALDLILKVNPQLTPAVSIRWMDSWVRENVEVIYRITPRMITGRRTVGRKKDTVLGRGKKAQLY